MEPYGYTAWLRTKRASRPETTVRPQEPGLSYGSSQPSKCSLSESCTRPWDCRLAGLKGACGPLASDLSGFESSRQS